MNEHRPQNNKNGKKSGYGSVPVRTKSSQRPGAPGKPNIKPAVKPSGGRPGGIPINKTGSRPINRPTGKSKYDAPKRQKIPTLVIITNVLMICVILSIVGVIFAIAFNNAKYDKDDASRNNRAESVVSSAANVSSTPQQSSVVTSSAEPASSAVSAENSGSGDVPVATPNGSFDKEFFKDDLFIGDSIFTGLYLYSHLERKNVAAAVGYTAYGAQVSAFDETFYSGSAVDYAKSLKPKRIFIMLGSNSLSPKTDFDDFENGYRGLINALKSGCPDSKICVISVPPITADSSMASYNGVTNTIINTANARIKTVAGDLGVVYYDFHSVLKDADGCLKEEYAEADGMHFLGATYPVLLSGLQKAVE